MVTLRDGRVLLAGGYAEDFEPVSATAIWNPATGKWAKGPRMTKPRGAVALAALPDGRVLAVGGEAEWEEVEDVATLAAEIYDPASNRWRRTASIPWNDGGVITAVVTGERVLVQSDNGSQALYDPKQGTWKSLPEDDEYKTLVGPLPNGTALATSGASVYRFDPKSGWRSVGSLSTDRGMPAPGETDAAVAVLEDGRVLFAGGYSEADDTHSIAFPIRTAELFDPETGTSAPVTEMPIAREGGLAVPLEDGSVLVVGGVETYEQAANATYEDTYACIPLEFRAVRWIP